MRKTRNYDAVPPYDFKALECAKKLDRMEELFKYTSQIANDYLDADMEKKVVKYMFLAQSLAVKSKKTANVGKAEETIGYYYKHDKPAQAISTSAKPSIIIY